MSTTFELAKKTVNEREIILDVTEQSAQFSIALSGHLETMEYGGEVEIERLSAEEAIDAGLKLIQVVLYSYPELFPRVTAGLLKLIF